MSAQVNHKPATPLPWEQNHPAIARVLAADGIDPRDVPYIIYAANAYPKLVEALREAESALSYYAKHARGALNDRPAGVGAKTARLLRELGEDV